MLHKDSKVWAAKYIETITDYQKAEPARKHTAVPVTALPVSTETFEFFINLLDIRLPTNDEKRLVFSSYYIFFLTWAVLRIRSSKVQLLTGKWGQLSDQQFNDLQAKIRKWATKKVRKISRVLHPDKCRFKQSPWSEDSQDALAFINKGTNR